MVRGRELEFPDGLEMSEELQTTAPLALAAGSQLPSQLWGGSADGAGLCRQVTAQLCLVGSASSPQVLPHSIQGGWGWWCVSQPSS